MRDICPVSKIPDGIETFWLRTVQVVHRYDHILILALRFITIW